MFPLTARYQAITPARGFVLASLLTALTHPVAEYLQESLLDGSGLARFLTLFYSSMAVFVVAWATIAYGGQALTYGVGSAKTRAAQRGALYDLGPGMSSFWV